MRVVLDANVWVSAAIQAGPSHRIVQRWLAGGTDFEVILCPTLIAEVADVLTQRPRMRKWIDLDVAERYADTLRALADVVPDPEAVGSTTRDVDAVASCVSASATSHRSPDSTEAPQRSSFVDYVALLKEMTDRGDRHGEVRRVLEQVGLSDRASTKVKAPSGGMRRPGGRGRCPRVSAVVEGDSGGGETVRS